jgi:hypothetical protein
MSDSLDMRTHALVGLPGLKKVRELQFFERVMTCRLRRVPQRLARIRSPLWLFL